MTKPAAPWSYLLVAGLSLLVGVVGTGLESRISIGNKVVVNTSRLDKVEDRLDKLEKGTITADLFKVYADSFDKRLSNIEASQQRIEKRQPAVIWGGTIGQATRAKKPN